MVARAKAAVKPFKFSRVTVWNVKLPKGAVLDRHFHSSSYVVHPLRRGRVRVLYYDSQTAPKPVREEIRDLVPGEPYEIDVTPPGIWVEIVNDDDDTEWDKDEPGGKP